MIKRSDVDGGYCLKVSQEKIAQQLGVSRQSINRQLKIWETQGLLVVRYSAITILDLQKLKETAGGE
ncbi:helix-turn-helix domain-containing protein [Pseudomonas graminis]|uniref:helix-turn-helix domain-containing protein n=1 Tax=Pseudomonas graminis TaxID=158627 RepID=UPI001559655B|nr:helix-turn-helix domain-containing protein [Pseudomonas graminis]